MDDVTDKHVKYEEQSSQQDEVPRKSSQQDVLPQESSHQHVVPQESSHQHVVPQESSHQHVVPQESLPQEVIPQESSHPDLIAQESSLKDMVPQELPLQDEMPRELPILSARISSRVTLQEQRIEDKRRRVREARSRLLMAEQKAKQVLVPKGAHSQKFSQDDNDKNIGTSLSADTSSDASDANENVVEEDDDYEKMTMEMVEQLSSSSGISFKKYSDRDSVASDDPLRTKVHDLMLVPSLSDFSLSDVPVLKSNTSLKSLASSVQMVGAESESGSSESESVDRMDSHFSLPKMEVLFERVDDSTELARESLSYPEIHEVQFDDTPQIRKTLNFEEFVSKTIHVRGSSLIQENQLIAFTKKMISDFVDMLISKVIGRDDPNDERRNMLDRNKLYAGIKESLTEYVNVLARNEILNQRVGEYYHINKNFRVFADLSEEDRFMYFKRYKAALSSVAFAEEKIIEAKAKASKLILMAQLDLNHFTHTALGTEHHFEQAVRRLLIRSDSSSDQMKRLIERELRLMNQHRTEISYKRYLVIALQHDLAKLKEEIQKLDTFDDHVCMQDFITLQSKVYHFQQKIDERNIELRKMRAQYHKELYQVHNNREKILALKDRICFWSDHLDRIQEKRNVLKKQLIEGKTQHLKIRTKNNELAYQGGILSMPSLMSDYDATMATIQQKHESIAGLKETVKHLTNRLSNMNDSSI